uniref:Zinc finger CCCH domain-containing protein 17 n=1 Tax=Aegilops tauschii TaxID=37682 RepID=N1R5L9_AEGTA
MGEEQERKGEKGREWLAFRKRPPTIYATPAYMWVQARPDADKTAHNRAAITGISMPMGSDKLYSGSADGSVRVWDGNSGKCVDVIKMGGKIGCMITHDKWVFVGISKSVEAWNIQTGMKLSLQGPSGLVCSMTIKDEMLFAGMADGRIMAWKFPAKEINSELVAILAGHDRHVISLAVSATRLYSGSLDKTIRVWDLKNLQCVQTLSEHKAAVTSVLCWDQKLLSCSLDKTVKVWAASESGSLQLMHTHSEEHCKLCSNRNDIKVNFSGRLGATHPLWHASSGKDAGSALLPPQEQPRPPVGPAIVSAIQNTLSVVSASSSPVTCNYLFPSFRFEEMGTLSSKTEVKTIELAQGGPSRLLFTGDGAGELKVWMWAPQGEESPTPALP